ncbi:MAG TPA: hypothetical protein VJ201_02780 [Candidatus Babeliales bacterium]|nr:hypothetical protein [Candidatus Babeliales bacterium]
MVIRSLFLLVIGCATVSFAHAMETKVKLPSAELLREYLKHGGFGSFANETNIDRRLANSEMLPLQLSKIIGREVYYYNLDSHERAKKQLNNVGIEITPPVCIKKEAVLRCILFEEPKVCEALLEHEEKHASKKSKL